MWYRAIDVTSATSLSSADVKMTVFMSFCIRTNSFIVWADNPRNSSDNLAVSVIPFILSSVLQSNFSLATSIAIHNYKNNKLG